MTKKQMKRLAKQIYEYELAHEHASSKEEKAHVEDKIMKLTNQISSQGNGLEIMLELDAMVQQLLNSNIKEND